MATPIYCFNKSSVLKNTDMFLMINAINAMLPAFCTSWSLKQYTCIAAPSTTKVGSTGMYCVFLDTSTSPGTLAFHTETGNVPYGEVFVKTVLKYGGAILMGANNTIPTVAQAFAHEIFEMLVNPNINVWWQVSNSTLVPAEVCDPVQSVVVPIKVGSVTVGMSDYILPEWNDPQSTKGPYNFLNTLTRPFQMSKGGYLVSMKAGSTSYVFGETASDYAKARSEYLLEYMKSKISEEPVVEVPTEEAPPFSSAESFAPILFGNHTDEPSS
jgi:hypothetical protein